MYSLELTRAADRYLDRLDAATRRRIAQRIDSLSTDPLDPKTSKPLHGRLHGLRSSRVGEYRIVFEVIHQRVVVYVHEVGPRGDIYKQ